ncbi:hypothetical protein D3C83_85440 [compost metagenome]
MVEADASKVTVSVTGTASGALMIATGPSMIRASSSSVEVASQMPTFSPSIRRNTR